MKPSEIRSFFERKFNRKRMRRYLPDINGKVNMDSDSQHDQLMNYMCWTGIVDQYEQDQKLSPDEQYIWHLHMEGNIKLAVTMNLTLAALIHTAQYLVGDYTFKQVNGKLDECEFVIWYAETNEHELTLGDRNHNNWMADCSIRCYCCMAILQFCHAQGIWLCFQSSFHFH
jgi:hypothetical protein